MICALFSVINEQMKNYLLLVKIFLVVETSVALNRFSVENLGSFCKNDTPYGTPNMFPIESSPPRLIQTIQNGSLYQVGAGEDQSWLIHVWGSSGYDYGFAYGTLLSEQINQLLPNAYAYLEQEIIDNIDTIKLPKWFKAFVVDNGLAFALDVQNTLVHSYMEEEIYNELRGIADGAKIDYTLLVHLHMFEELFRGNIAV